MLAPYAQQAGQPVRFDKLLAKLAESGFSWSRDEVEEILPLIRFERESGQEGTVDQMLIQNAMLQQAAMQIQSLFGGAGGGPGQELPQPRSENEAIESNQKRNETQVGRV